MSRIPVPPKRVESWSFYLKWDDFSIVFLIPKSTNNLTYVQAVRVRKCKRLQFSLYFSLGTTANF